jgi:valyl-tRNA synthetase
MQAKQSLATLLSTFEATLRLLSPFMPFLTEELWHAVYENESPAKSIALSAYPRANAAPSSPRESGLNEMLQLNDIVTKTRSARKALGVPDKEKIDVDVEPNAALGGYLHADPSTDFSKLYRFLARVNSVRIQYSGDGDGPSEVKIIYEKQIDPIAERARLTKDLAQQEKEFANNQRQLGNDGFLAKAPAHVVEGLRTRAAELTVLLDKNRAALAALDAKE